MAITINSNLAALRAQRRLASSSRELTQVFDRLSSGLRINRASDDAAGLAISQALDTDRAVFNQGIRNLNDGVSLLSIADSTLAELSSITTRITELAEQAGNGSITRSQRLALDAEAQELSREFTRIIQTTEFNGVTLFDGSLDGGLSLQLGYGTNGNVTSSIGGATGDGTFQTSLTNDYIQDEARHDFADFNNDGILDSVKGGQIGVASGVIVQLGNGDGTFASEFLIDQTTHNPNEVFATDVNNDGQVDILAVGATGADVYLNDGTGNFSATQLVSDISGGSGVQTIADINEDGYVDIVFTRSNAGNISISTAYGNGDGTFQDTVLRSLINYGAASTPVITAGNVDGDSGVELIINFDAGANAQTVVYDTAASGDFSVIDSITNVSTAGSNGVALGDIDGDGDLDIAVGGSNGNSILEALINDGNGNFTADPIVTLASGGFGTTDFAIGDVDGDGINDILVGGLNAGLNDALYRVSRNENGTYESESLFSNASVGAMDQLELNDLNNDGVLDVSYIFVTGQENHLGNTADGVSSITPFSLQTQADALQSLAKLETKRDLLASQRGEIGAFISRVSSALNVQRTTSENYAAASSQIKDTDVASEASRLARVNILNQASAAILAQANTQPAIALSLLQR